MQVRIVTSYNCASVGEAMRLLDNRGVIKDDFILVSADTVTSMSLAPVLAAHRARRCATFFPHACQLPANACCMPMHGTMHGNACRSLVACARHTPRRCATVFDMSCTMLSL